MDLIKKIQLKEPEYDACYEELIKKFTIDQGGQAGKVDDRLGTVAYEQGRFFSTKYEIYMYALLIGMKKNLKHPTPSNAKSKKFIKIESWQPRDLANYCIMSIIGVSDLDLEALEQMEEKEIDREVTKLKNLMEAYANGGLDFIKAEYENNEMIFENNELVFFDLLDK